LDYYIGAMMLVPYNFAPVNFMFCQGQILQISQNTALFSLLGTYFGGNGTSNFALPNLQGCVALGAGQAPGLSPYVIGEAGGVATVQLIPQLTPQHTHTIQGGRATASQKNPNANALATASGNDPKIFTTTASNLVQMQQLPPQGSNQPHNNLMPYLTLQWIICVKGIFPARN